ncbi:MAG: GNAT family N-acetyltransferase [Candidatus Omnitrophica bacterium]|nr:GNAT family N-acetyltransferase [Candidatus Omnitrophota bacterium]
MDVKVILTMEQFEALRDEWDTLNALAEDINIFGEFDWVFTWWQHFHKDYELFILQVKDQGQTVAIAPWMKVRRHGFCMIEFIGYDVSDFETVLCLPGKEEQALDAILKFLLTTGGWDIMRLQKVKSGSRLFSALMNKSQMKARGYCFKVHPHKEQSMVINTTGTWAEHAKKIRPKLLADTRRCEKRLSELGTVSFDFKAQFAGDFPALLSTMRDWHMARLDDKNTRSFLTDKTMSAFLESVGKIFHDKQWLDISRLTVNSKAVAIHWGFSYKGLFYYYVPVFDQSYKAYSPSRILLSKLLMDSFGGKVQLFDFMLGEEPYKMEWVPEKQWLYFAYFSPPTWRGQAAFWFFDKFVLWIKKLRGISW